MSEEPTRESKVATRIVGASFVGILLLIGSLLTVRPYFVAALSVPEHLDDLEEKHVEVLKRIQTLEERREGERLILERLSTEMSYVRRTVEDIQRTQRQVRQQQ